MSTQSTFFPSPIPRTTSAFSLSKPDRARTSTAVRARPKLSVFTSAKPHTFTGKPTHHKISSGLITNTSLSTIQTIHDNSTSGGTRLSKTPSTLTRKALAHCGTLEEKAKNETMGILDLTSVQVFKPELQSGIIEDPSYGNALTLKLTRTMTAKSKETHIKEFDGPLSVRKERHGKTLSLGPIGSFDMREIAREAQSNYTKSSRNVEYEVRQYIQKLRLLDIADARRIRNGGVNIGRRELAMTSRDHACNVMGLTHDERERLMDLEIEDMDFFKKMEAILVESLKRIERLERLNEEIELREGAWTRMDADRLEWRYCFVDLKGKAPPLKLSVRTRKEVKSLRIFIAKQHKRPNKLNCDFEYENKKVIKLYDKDRIADTFSHPFFYFAISPDESGFMSVNVEFGEVENEIKLIDIIPKGSETVRAVLTARSKISFADAENSHRETREARTPNKLQHLKLSKEKVDIMEENKRNLEQYTPERYSQRLEERKIKLADLIQSTLRKKVEILRHKREKSLALYIKRDVQKCVRDILSENDKKKMKFILVQKSWFSCIALYQAVNRFSQVIIAHKKAQEERMKKVMIMTNLLRRVRSQQKPKGTNMEERIMLDIRLALELIAKLCKGDGTGEAEHTVALFCEDLSVVCTIRDKFDEVVETIKKVQKAWREYARKKEGFMDMLQILWNKNYENVFQKMVKGEHSQNLIRIPNARDVLKKLNPQELRKSEFAKDRFVDTYLDICRERYMKNYDIYDQHRASHKDTQKPSIFDIFKGLPALKAIKAHQIKPSQVPSRTRVSIMAEIEHGSARESTPTEPSSLVLTSPPRLFMLPTPEELEELLGKAIVAQVMATLPRASIIGRPF